MKKIKQEKDPNNSQLPKKLSSDENLRSDELDTTQLLPMSQKRKKEKVLKEEFQKTPPNDLHPNRFSTSKKNPFHISTRSLNQIAGPRRKEIKNENKSLSQITESSKNKFLNFNLKDKIVGYIQPLYEESIESVSEQSAYEEVYSSMGGFLEYTSELAHPPYKFDDQRDSISVYYQAQQDFSTPPESTTTLNEETYMVENTTVETGEQSIEKHKNVITHLLTQVKLGMDMTKITLPTFILEKRSLLEMYADFFSHSDYFVEIAKAPTSEERFVACIRFFMSTFSAGRNSSVPKKPYNPILGEIFRCFFDHPSLIVPGKAEVLESDGPVPWCASNQLSFLAEQVSHHPPVSAFYAEHQDFDIQFTGHIWTKSKFMGLSIAVHNVGRGAIYLPKYKEEYVMNFPSGYGRSILSVPWIEMGGDCAVTCEKSGYSAVIRFHTKPFYGGKLHRVTGEILKPNEIKPIYTLEGTWNDVIESKSAKGKTKIFFNSSKPKVIKKVKLIEFQETFESRRLWKDVTKNLEKNYIEKATDAKQIIEEKQREEAKNRLLNAIEYKPKFFVKDSNGNWTYKRQLRKRKANFFDKSQTRLLKSTLKSTGNISNNSSDKIGNLSSRKLNEKSTETLIMKPSGKLDVKPSGSVRVKSSEKDNGTSSETEDTIRKEN